MPLGRASVIYDDFVGTAAADELLKGNVSDLLIEKGLMTKEEFVVSVRLDFGEYHPGGHMPRASMDVFVTKGDFDTLQQRIRTTNRARLRKVQVDLPVDEFVRFWKRIAIVLHRRDLGLEAAEIDPVENW